jgi:threonine/homoserine/homoserine lactone efflux protein
MAVSLLPQYAVADAAATSTLVLGVVWAGIAFLWNGVWVAASRNRLHGSRARLVQRAGGLLVAGIGALGLAQAV